MYVVLMRESREQATYISILRIISQTCLIIDLAQWSPKLLMIRITGEASS